MLGLGGGGRLGDTEGLKGVGSIGMLGIQGW